MKALFSGSFDPFTLGHLDIVKKALKEFDELIICVSNNEEKKHLLSLEERKKIIISALSDLQTTKKITVICNTGTTIDVALKYKVDTLIRGIRNLDDIENEKALAKINEQLAQIRGFKIEHYFVLQTDPFLKSASSSIVRRLCAVEEYIAASQYVPQNVHQELMSIYLKTHFRNLFAKAYIPRSEELWRDLVNVYKSRPYHNLTHLAYMLNMYKIYLTHTDKNDITPHTTFNITLAIFLHDYIYDVERDDNEEASAQLAHEICKGAMFYHPRKILFDLILATKHINDTPLTGDAAILADIDLSLLGTQSPQIWDNYCAGIRKEYAIYSNQKYAHSRIAFLKRLLMRKRIFNTEFFYQRFEKQARKNIKKEIFKLKKLL